jgi:predicted PurR-regulated permease PerM
MGLLFGPLGLLLSAPLAVFAYVAVGELYLYRLLGEASGRLDQLFRPSRDAGKADRGD